MFKFTFLSLILWGLVIQITSAQGGTSCENATIANQGINISNNALGEQWFVYTATMTGKVTVSTCGLTEANTYVEIYDACGENAFASSNDFCNEQSEVSFEVIDGLSYLINWKNYYTNSQFEWDLQEGKVNQGEFCSNPLMASAGYTVSDAPQNKYRWFEFTASRNGKITVEAVGDNAADCRIAVYDNCMFTSTVNNDLSWNPSKIAFDGIEGKRYLISWQNGDINGEIAWTIEESNWEPGERCIDPIDVSDVEGAPINHESGTNKWYRFIARENGEINVSSVGLTQEDTYVEVYSGCGEGRIAFNDDTEGLQAELTMDVSKGKAYWIKWDNIFMPEQYAWSLKSDIPTDLPEVEEKPVKLFPNPSEGVVYADLTGYDTKEVSVRVVDISGAAVKTLQLPGGLVVSFDLSDLNTGVYNVIFEDLVSQSIVKFLKK
ncbi:T9SS type A sorting domain-containing protein [Labilibacter sediminis]|nr:T9SS type A sorting domain-containing protein [Labilibacter sediminis]